MKQLTVLRHSGSCLGRMTIHAAAEDSGISTYRVVDCFRAIVQTVRRSWLNGDAAGPANIN
ncbi:hypothetical protein, partial [Type-E symbiont of Plautia stali]|uniref:hypothetical protein n=1 Tax=Type-E symbiont of Plautia stali TaxID=1560357 RepID=UPI00256FD70D